MAEMTTELAVNVKGGQVEAEGQSRRGSEEGQSGEEWAEEGYHKQWKALQGQRLGRLGVSWNVGGELGQGKWPDNGGE